MPILCMRVFPQQLLYKTTMRRRHYVFPMAPKCHCSTFLQLHSFHLNSRFVWNVCEFVPLKKNIYWPNNRAVDKRKRELGFYRSFIILSFYRNFFEKRVCRLLVEGWRKHIFVLELKKEVTEFPFTSQKNLWSTLVPLLFLEPSSLINSCTNPSTKTDSCACVWTYVSYDAIFVFRTFFLKKKDSTLYNVQLSETERERWVQLIWFNLASGFPCVQGPPKYTK